MKHLLIFAIVFGILVPFCQASSGDTQPRPKPVATVASQTAESPITKVEKEFGGKLFLVRTISALSSDGSLLPPPKGVHLGTIFDYQTKYLDSSTNKLTDYNPIFIADPRATVHFTLNHLVPSPDFAESATVERPFTVIIPMNQDHDHDLMNRIISVSWPEVVLLGQYTLPANTIILARADKVQNIPQYYRNHGFEVVTYENEEYTQKRDAVNKVIKAKGGMVVDMSAAERRPWTYLSVTTSQGIEVNTPEFFKELFPGRPVAFGDDEVTHWLSKGQHWRIFGTPIYNRFTRYFGEVGFSMEEYNHSRARNWLATLDLPEEALETYDTFTRNSLIAHKATDFVFDHFQNRELAFKYISDHLLPLQESGAFETIKNDHQFPYESIDSLAKRFCDYEYLVLQPKADGGWDLATKAEIIDSLANASCLNMKPTEFQRLLVKYGKKSSIIHHFSPKENNLILKVTTARYLVYLNYLFTGQFGPMMKSPATLAKLRNHAKAVRDMLAKVQNLDPDGTLVTEAERSLLSTARTSLLELLSNP